MNDNKLANDVFVEEINENLIIAPEKEKNKKKFMSWFMLLFCCLSLILSLFFMYKLGVFSFNNKTYIEKNLIVAYSTSSFGDVIDDFSIYNSYDSAYLYTFYIKNGNKEELSYNIILNVLDIENGTKILYSIEKNSEKLFEGNLDNSKKYSLISQNILSDVTDEYKLKLWNQDGTDSSIKFKIEVKN